MTPTRKIRTPLVRPERGRVRPIKVIPSLTQRLQDTLDLGDVEGLVRAGARVVVVVQRRPETVQRERVDVARHGARGRRAGPSSLTTSC